MSAPVAVALAVQFVICVGNAWLVLSVRREADRRQAAVEVDLRRLSGVSQTRRVAATLASVANDVQQAGDNRLAGALRAVSLGLGR